MQFQTIESSNLESAAYDGKDKCQVKFKSGGTYEYSGIKPETWKQFESTFQTKDSSGKFFRANIQKAEFKKL